MQYINMHTDTLRSSEYIGSSPAERGTWFSVLGWCVTQENGGRMVGAALWKDRQWQQTCGVTLREVRSASRLLNIEGDDVVVVFYPIDKEEIVRKKREVASHGGRAKALAYARANGIADKEANGEAYAVAKRSAERKGKEYNTPLPPLQGDLHGSDSVSKSSDSSPSADAEFLEKKEKGGPALARVRGLFRIRATTPLDAAERRAWEKAWRAVVATDGAGWRALEWWFSLPADAPAAKFRKRKPAFLLNAWNGEVQAAITVAHQNGVEVRANGRAGLAEAPEGWRDLVGELDPEFHCPDRWEELPEPVRRAVVEEVKRRK